MTKSKKQSREKALQKEFTSIPFSRECLIGLSYDVLTADDVLKLSDEDMQHLADRVGEAVDPLWFDYMIEDYLPEIVEELTGKPPPPRPTE